MKKMLLAGATGQLGNHIFRELKVQGYDVRVLARHVRKAQSLFPNPEELVLADATDPAVLAGCCTDVDVVISAIGKNVSLRHQGQGSFQRVNYGANLNLLQEAERAGVKQFIYISAYGADRYPQLAYFKAHADFERRLRQSRLAHAILQPVMLFSAVDEMVSMAQKGRIGQMGKGDKRINPIHDGEVAKAVLQCIGRPNQTMALGGPKVYTRKELAELVCELASYAGRVQEIPLDYMTTLLPLVRLLSSNLHDKLAYLEVLSKEDFVAPPVGKLSLETYFELEPQLVSS